MVPLRFGDAMAFQRGRQAAEETAKAECLRRWPELKLKGRTLYRNERREGVSIERDGGIFVAAAVSSSEAWSNALSKLEETYK